MLKITKKLLKKIKKPKPIVAIIRLQGIIGKSSFNQGLTLNNVKYLDKIKKAKNLKSIALIINSPGGSPVQAEYIAKKITNIAKHHKIPIFSFCEDVAASGGYWFAAVGDEIYASNSSIIGSIGVISQGFGFTEAIHAPR